MDIIRSIDSESNQESKRGIMTTSGLRPRLGGPNMIPSNVMNKTSR